MDAYRKREGIAIGMTWASIEGTESSVLPTIVWWEKKSLSFLSREGSSLPKKLCAI